jgi:hypothetical protein
MDERICRRLIEAANRLPDSSAAAEGHRAEADLRHEHGGIARSFSFTTRRE